MDQGWQRVLVYKIFSEGKDVTFLVVKQRTRLNRHRGSHSSFLRRRYRTTLCAPSSWTYNGIKSLILPPDALTVLLSKIQTPHRVCCRTMLFKRSLAKKLCNLQLRPYSV
jgi:hypothetical protein